MNVSMFDRLLIAPREACPLCVVIVNRHEAKQFISRYHYLGDKPFRSIISFGLKRGDELIGVAVYHNISAPETAVGAFGLQRHEQEGLWELGRLALRPDCNGGNYGSFLIRRSITLLKKLQPVRVVIAYADATLHVGAVYQAAGFLYCGLTAQKHDFYVNGKIQERGKTRGVAGEWRERPRKHRYIVIFDKNLSLKWPVLPYFKSG